MPRISRRYQLIREFSEKEPNDFYAKPQLVEAMPVTVNGRLDRVSEMSILMPWNLRRGHHRKLQVDAYTLASKVDALLQGRYSRGSATGVESRFHPSPLSASYGKRHPAPVTSSWLWDFKYTLDAGMSRLTGGDGCVYRLHLNALLCPPSIAAGERMACSNTRPNGTLTNAAMLSFPATIHGAIAWPGDEDWFAFEAEKGSMVGNRPRGRQPWFTTSMHA